MKLSNSKILNFVLFLAIIALVGGGVLAWQAGWFKEVSDDGGAAPQSGAAQEQAQAEQKKLAQAAGELSVAPLSETYEDPDFGFSLNYPSALALTQIPADPESGAAETIIFEQAGAGLGFQIAVSPFTEENADITPERIKVDIPDMVIFDPEDVNLGALGKGTTFLDGDAKASGANRQIWFAGNGYLFQITAVAAFDPVMQKILATWKFE
ncbi:MAG TPA: hypothetical protein DEP25_01000 [Candidatus Taylorbacteria bacterium]|nr:MAG: hypothetical protein A3G61_04350 [Candidatus Taylorbacteria bacterium RIFCSPLOWO2_12_FULL_49_67]HCB35198.1 hypothetical protein [Candidatus Taylorbacteria bacterium]